IIKDSLDHSLFINGNLYSKNNPGYDVDLDLTSRGFTFINAPKAINNQIYGYSGMDTRITVKGTTLTPLMEGSIVLNDQTDITMVLPEKNTNSDAASSVVRFISANKPSFPQQATGSAIDGTGIDSVTPLNYKLNITSDKNSLLTIVIDPTTGDELKVKGTARLEVVNGPGGNAAITGIYLLDSGYYELNYQFLKKRFNLMPGSTIRFNGNPMEAQVNIRAEYIANTAARDLLGNEVGSVGTRIARSFNQKIPFRVLLMLRGPLNKPVISFNIELPEDRTLNPQLRRTIENKLVQLRADIAATNKQVFALLVLERFVGEQSIDFFKGNGSDFSDIANESVSKFLSSAMDQIASDLFKGINFDLNLNSYKDFNDNDDVQKTDLNVEVSKNFLNDRLSVSVGRNFGIESQDASTKASQQKARRFLPDVTVNSKLSTDGKYMIRSYKKSPFDVVLDGYVVETGLAFIVTMDYDLFNELFFRKNKKRE
ncbi:MAG: translocation/assembly module TamB domain-containing protein, partial [Ferruginibacter sp.]